MKRIMDLAHRLLSKLASSVITFAYNPNQAEIFQLLWDTVKLSILGADYFLYYKWLILSTQEKISH